MKRFEPKSPFFFRFSIFGINVYISRKRMKLRQNPSFRSKTLRNAKYTRLERAGHRCELCGITIDRRCTLYHLLPVGYPDRNKVRNLRVICPQCHQHVLRIGAYRPMIPLCDAPGAMTEIKQ